jgi:hypothetical protein
MMMMIIIIIKGLTLIEGVENRTLRRIVGAKNLEKIAW